MRHDENDGLARTSRAAMFRARAWAYSEGESWSDDQVERKLCLLMLWLCRPFRRVA